MDFDNDQKLDWMEFETGAYDAYMNYITLETRGEADVFSEEDVFAMLDLDQDEYVSFLLFSGLLSNFLFSHLFHYAQITRFGRIETFSSIYESRRSATSKILHTNLD